MATSSISSTQFSTVHAYAKPPGPIPFSVKPGANQLAHNLDHPDKDWRGRPTPEAEARNAQAAEHAHVNKQANDIAMTRKKENIAREPVNKAARDIGHQRRQEYVDREPVNKAARDQTHAKKAAKVAADGPTPVNPHKIAGMEEPVVHVIHTL